MAKHLYGFAIVGGGVIAPSHAQAIADLPNARLLAVVDTDADRATQRATELGAHAYTSLTEALARPDVDIVCVCVPTGLHAQVGIEAAEAGKHLVVEKPLEVSLAAADRLIAACRASGVKLAVVSQMRFGPAIQRLKRALDSGELGKPFLGQAVVHWYRTDAYYASAGWRGTWELDGGGALTNQGVHFVDQLAWLLGPVESVYGRRATATHDTPVEDVALAMLTFESGAHGIIQASTATFPGFMERIEIFCTGGSVIIEGGEIVVWESRTERGETTPYGVRLATGTRAVPADVTTAGGVMFGGLIVQIRDLLEAIEGNREPLINGEEARKPLEIIHAVYESARDGREVRVGGVRG